jgi:hypothetical protein
MCSEAETEFNLFMLSCDFQPLKEVKKLSVSVVDCQGRQEAEAFAITALGSRV